MRRNKIPSALRPATWLPLAVLLAAGGGAWQWAARTWPYALAPLPKIGSAFAHYSSYFLANAGTTLGEAMGGLAIGFAVAFAAAVLISEVPAARRAVLPVAVVLNVTPLVAVAPLLVAILGFGDSPKILIAALVCFFPILINTATGLRSVPAPVLQVYQTVRASRLEVLAHLRVPSALPYIFAALRITFPLSVIGAVVAEMTAAGGGGGLGYVISQAASANQLAVVYAAIFTLAVMGALLLLLVTAAERRALRWHDSTKD